MWFKGVKQSRHVEIGNEYRHRLGCNVLEKAHVLGIEKDMMGIPHVTYDLVVERSDNGTYSERRTLALQSFKELFDEAIYA